MQSTLKDAGRKSEPVVYDGLDHYLHDGDVRAAMPAKANAFFAASMPAK